MALTESFNQFAGKIISNNELVAKLKVAGFDPNIGTSPELFIQKVSAAENAGQGHEVKTMIEDVGTSVYMTAKAIAEIEEDVLQAKGKGTAMITLKNSLLNHADDLYLNIHPAVKFVSWAHGDKKLVDAFIKAAEECADHRDKVGTDLLNMNTAVKGIVDKISARFGI